MSSTLIKVNNLLKNYKSITLHHENISIKEGITILFGKNGSGKSTLLKGITSLIKSKSDIVHDVRISYLPEKMELPNINTYTYLKLSVRNQKLLEKNIDLFQLRDHLSKDIHELSKGMKIKVRLIVCLTKEADIYILDEPFNGLDKSSLHLLIRYINKSSSNFLVSTHLDLLGKFKTCNVIRL